MQQPALFLRAARLDTAFTDKPNLLTRIDSHPALTAATGADLSPDGRTLAVLSYTDLYLFRDPVEDKWFSESSVLRVALDARLFDRLAAADAAGLPGLPLLDAALQQVLQVPPTKAGRPLAPRIAGALRLYRLHAAAAGLLVALAVLAWCPR